MAILSQLCEATERTVGHHLAFVSGGNSANLNWIADHADIGRINNLRLGEAILLGREPLERTAIPGLRADAFTIVGEVIESLRKPDQPWGERHASTFESHRVSADTAKTIAHCRSTQLRTRAIIALGHQDIDPAGLVAHDGSMVVGASSDHLIIDTGTRSLPVGTEVRFSLDYSALLRALTSPFVEPVFVT